MKPPLYENDFCVTLAQVAVLLDVEHSTTRVWRTRGVLPPSDAPEMPEPVWWVSTLMRWAAATGRKTELRALTEAVQENIRAEQARPASPEERWQKQPIWRGGMPMSEAGDLSGLGRPLPTRDTPEQALCTEAI